MSLACLVDEPMAKAKRNDRPVKVDVGVVVMAEHVALSRGMSLAEYVSETLRPAVTRDYQAFLDSQAKAVAKPPKR